MAKQRFRVLCRTALTLLGYQAAFGFFGLMLMPSLMGSGDALRIPLAGVLVALGGFLLFMEGMYRGEKECAVGDTLDKLAAKGSYRAADAENAKRYSRAKGVLASFLGALPALALAVYVALTAKPYAYSLQDLPGWLSAYMGRPEIGAPLAYLQDVGAAATVTDYLRVAVRFVLFPYVGLMGDMSDAASLAFDRLAPLLTLILPALAAAGYQFGPLRRAKTVREIEKAKRTPRKRLKKNRASGTTEKKQLI